jgi:probable HAF family extracellular repeat protein
MRFRRGLRRGSGSSMTHHTTTLFSLATLLTTLSAVDVGAAAAASPQDLGTLGGASAFASDINNSEQVVGLSFVASGDAHAFLWVGGQMRDLGTLGGSFSSAAAINESGQVVGLSFLPASSATHAFVWQAGRGMKDLGTLPGGSFSEANGINARGDIVGDSDGHAVVWLSGTIHALDAGGAALSSAAGINDARTIAGTAFISGFAHAVIWRNGGAMTDIGTLGGTFSSASGINQRGQVVGNSETSTGATHGFIWDNGTFQDLGPTPDANGAARAINERGQAVGSVVTPVAVVQASFFTGGAVTLLPAPTGSTSSSAASLNDRAEAVGGAFGATSFHALLWRLPTH